MYEWKVAHHGTQSHLYLLLPESRDRNFVDGQQVVTYRLEKYQWYQVTKVKTSKLYTTNDLDPNLWKITTYFLGSLVCPPCEDVCEGKPPSLTSSSKTLSGHGGVADRYRRVTIWFHTITSVFYTQ